MAQFRRSLPLLLLLAVSMLVQLQLQQVGAQLASATLQRLNGQATFQSQQSINTTEFLTLPYPQQLPVMRSPGLTINVVSKSSSYTSGGATVSCNYAVCFQTLIRSTPDWTVWPYGGCVSMGANDTGYYTDISNQLAYGYNNTNIVNNTLPSAGSSFTLPTKAGPFHVAIATIVGSNAPSNAGAACNLQLTVDTNNNACIYDGEVAYMNQCTNLTYNVQSATINTTLSTGGVTPPSGQPSLMIGFTPSTPWINTISLEVISNTGNSGDNTTIHGEQGAGYVGGNAYQPGLQNFTRTATGLAANNTITVQTPVYRSTAASVLERTAYVFSVDPVTSGGSAGYSSITAHQYNCSVGAIGLINGRGCAVSARSFSLYVYPYGTVQQIGIAGANFAQNGLFYSQLVFYDEPGQSSFQVGAIPFGGNQAQMYIRKGGLPTPLVYDAYVNTSIPGNNQNGVFYDSGNTTLDGTPWYVAYGVNARAVQFVTQDAHIDQYSEQHLHNQHLFSSASHSFYDSPTSEMQHRSEYAVNRAVIDDMMERLNKTAGYNDTTSTITTSHERGKIQLDSKHLTSSSYSTQDWTQGLTLSFYSGASCINNCSYSTNGGNGFCNLNTHQCTCTNNWRSIDCSQYSPYSDHILSSVEKIVLPIVACLGSFLLGVALCIWLRRLPYRGYNQMGGGADGGLPGTGYALGTGAAVQGSRPVQRSAAPAAARPSAPAAASQSAAPAAGGGTARQAGTRLGRGANVHGFAAGH